MGQPIAYVPESLADLVEGFLSRRREDVKLFKEFILKDDFDSIKSRAHKIKGHAGGYGFHKLADFCREFELNCKLDNGHELEKILSQFEVYIRDVQIEYVKEES